MNFFNKMEPRYSGISMLVVFIGTISMIALFSGISSNAEVAVSPNSYVNEGNQTEIVTGQPEYVDGKKVNYTNTHVIPITPKLGERPTDPVVIPEKRTCEQGRWCDKRFMNR